MRFYAWGNMYLSSIQQGIQAGHVIGNMSVKYGANPDSMYCDWAKNHKTMILLNGGMSCNLGDIVEHFSKQDNPFEWAPFSESRDALDGALTSVGIILPEDVYENAKKVRKREIDLFHLDPWEATLYDIMNSSRMAQ